MRNKIEIIAILAGFVIVATGIVIKVKKIQTITVIGGTDGPTVVLVTRKDESLEE